MADTSDIIASAPSPARPAAKPRKSHGFWYDAWRRFRRKPLAMIALGYVIFMSLVAISSPMIVGTKPIICKYKGVIYFPCIGYFYPKWENPLKVRVDMNKRYSPTKFQKLDPDSWVIWPLVFQDPERGLEEGEWPGLVLNKTGEPNSTNLLGADQKGEDVFAKIVHGTRTALLVGFVSTGISALIGMTLGALAGYCGGWIDILLSRLMELMMCIPSLIMILALIAIVQKPTIWHTMIVLGATSWPSIARLMRAEFLKLRTVEYVTAARAIGCGQMRVMFRHIMPNALAPVLVPITFGIASAILVENALSFLGFGPPPPTASWGSLLSAGQRSMQMWWLIVFPGTAIFLTVLAYNLIGEGLQEATDPRLREGAK